MSIKFRFLSFVIIWVVYIFFMKFYSPLGIDWLSWHSQRIFNFSEYLKINGYFSSFGFSIWSSCTNCSLEANNWKGGIYLSNNIFTLSPYLIINHFFGKEGLIIFGPFVDKLTILISGLLLAEITIHILKKKNSAKKNYFMSLIIFTFFIINPWTYKMIVASWHIIFFVMFFLLGLFFILKKKINYSLISFFTASLFDIQSAAGLVVLFSVSIFIKYFYKKKLDINKYYFNLDKKNKVLKKILIVLLVPIIFHFFLTFIAINNLENFSGSSLLSRIGISGNDLHNGGILGSLQFLSGNRITHCILSNNFLDFFNKSLPVDNLIKIYNCFLSLIGMTLISIFSIYGVIKLFIKFNNFRIVILPLSFLLISYVCILQQSLSVHLMGYSFLFSILFSFGIMSITINFIETKKFFVSKLIFILPAIIGIILLCIRVSMLTGINS